MGNRYDKYKDSGIAWIGEIPEHWEVAKIKSFYNVILGKMVERNNDSNTGDENYLCAANIKWNGVDTEINKKMYFSDIEKEKYLLQYNDVLIMEGGMAGTACLYKNEFSPCYVQNSVNVCRAKKDFNNKFLYYWMYVPYYNGYIDAICNKATIRHYTKEKVQNTPILISSLVEQQTIATYLDQKCGEIDELITLQEEMITKLQSYKQSVITEAVTKGLDKNVPLKDSGIEWIGEIPEHWEVKRLKYFGNNYNGLTYSPNDICSSQEGIIVLRSSNIKDNKLCFDDNVYVNKEIPTKLLVNKGDILICSRNGSASLIGKAALIETDIKATFGAFMMIFRGNNICHKYLYYIVTSCISQYKWLFTTATINQLTSSMLGEIFAPFICNKLEQQSIADYLNQKCSEIDKLISIKQQKIEKLKEYKKSLIFECVTGKRKVS